MDTTQYVSADVAAVIVALGVLASLIFYAVTRVSPGGLVVPGVLVLTALEGLYSVATVVAATLVVYLLSQLATRYMILYGKRLFAAVLGLSVLVMAGAYLALHNTVPELFPANTVGFLAPGLIVYQLRKQKVMPTVVATSVVAVVCTGVSFGALTW